MGGGDLESKPEGGQSKLVLEAMRVCVANRIMVGRWLWWVGEGTRMRLGGMREDSNKHDGHDDRCDGDDICKSLHRHV